MNIRSLAIRLDVAFARFTGEVCDRGGHVAVKTPANPDYHWGNYLIFPVAPRKGDLARWRELYRQEFTYYDEIRHMTFTWDAFGAGDPSEFEEAGFASGSTTSLTAEKVTMPPKFNAEALVRPIAGDADLEQVFLLEMASAGEGFQTPEYKLFLRRRLESTRALMGAGKGFWLGAFLDGRMAGDLDLLHDGSFGVIAGVTTHPECRRKGICGRLVCDAVERARAYRGVETVLVEADPDYHAIKIYEAMGFGRIGENHTLEWSADGM